MCRLGPDIEYPTERVCKRCGGAVSRNSMLVKLRPDDWSTGRRRMDVSVSGNKKGLNALTTTHLKN